MGLIEQGQVMGGIGDEQGWAEAKRYHAQQDARRRAEREGFRRQRYQEVVAAIRRLAPAYPALRQVYLFGSLVQEGRHGPGSDIDVAVTGDDLEAESRFWQALEEALQADVDLRPLRGAVAFAVQQYGECVYDREVSPADTQHRG
jgi:predicted nucleotidyltransferase